MKIGVIGSGIVGQTLAAGFLKHGYQVMIGTRNPEKLADWQKDAGKGSDIASFAETAAFGETIVLAVKGTVALSALEMAGAANLQGKTVLDATNPIADAAPEDGVIKFFTTFDESLMEQLQQAFPVANFVKAFSCVGAALMVNPDFGDQKPTMFIAGNDETAKSEASKIIDQFGFEIEDMGTAVAARAIEPLCILWCIPGFRQNSWMHAFKMLR